MLRQSLFLFVVAASFALPAAWAGETWNGTYYYRGQDGVWKLTLSRDQRYTVTPPRGESFSAFYNASSSELALLGRRGGRLRHFRYSRFGDNLTLTPSNLDGEHTQQIEPGERELRRMPPRWGEQVTYTPRPFFPEPPRPDPIPPRPNPWPPKPNPWPPRPPLPPPLSEDAIFYWRRSWDFYAEADANYRRARENQALGHWKRYWINISEAREAERQAEYYARLYLREINGGWYHLQGWQLYDRMASEAQRRGESDRHRYFSDRSRTVKSGRSLEPIPPSEAMTSMPREMRR